MPKPRPKLPIPDRLRCEANTTTGRRCANSADFLMIRSDKTKTRLCRRCRKSFGQLIDKYPSAFPAYVFKSFDVADAANH